MTLLVIVILTIIVTAFLQSMTSEQKTARSYLNRYRAELAADAASELAMNRIRTFMRDHPYHASGVQKDPFTDKNASTGAIISRFPILTGSKTTSPTPTGGSDPLETNYLISAADPKIAPDASKLDDTNSVNINVLSSKDDTSGWIGSPVTLTKGTGTQVPQEFRAPWIELLADPKKKAQPDPKMADYNPVVARFAYWVEDETMKLDASVIGNGEKGGAFKRSKTGAFLTDLDLGAIPLQNKSPLPEGESTINSKILKARTDNPSRPLDSGILGEFTDDSPDNFKFHATTFSLSDELAGNGRRRANLNHIVDTSLSAAAGLDAKIIKGDLDDIVYTISGRHIFPGGTQTVFGEADEDTTGPLKDFGKRFYTTPDISAAVMGTSPNQLKHEDIYLLRLAANIRDYIDQDRQPTVVDSSKQIITQTQPQFSWNQGSEPMALGKEAIPYFQEHAWNFRMGNVTNNGGHKRNVSFTADQYFELYNPSTKDFKAPQGTKISVSSLPKFRAGNYPSVELQDFDLDLSGKDFPAGTAVVVTTAPSTSDDPQNMIPSSATIYRIHVADNIRKYDNQPGDVMVGSGSDAQPSADTRRYGIRLDGRSGSVDIDYQTEMVFSTPDGYLEAHPFIAIPGDTNNPVEMTLRDPGKGKTPGTFELSQPTRDKRLVWSSSLRGNDQPSRSGDARSLSEPMELVAGSNSAYGYDQGRFFSNINGSGDIPNTSTFGKPDISFVKPANWPDYNPTFTNSADTAYMTIADGEMMSIGELGNIYDPHRKLTSGADGASTTASDTTKIKRARGGGRTLKIGQPDDLLATNAARFSAGSTTAIAWNNAAWRLTDYFSTEPHEVVMSDSVQRGKININGVLRDGGVALRAALRSFEYLPSPEGDKRSTPKLSDADIDKLIDQLKDYQKTKGPLMERGELSQLDFFYNAKNSPAGQNAQTGQSTANDRSREELFRRVVELITTRSASYSVYAIGQAVRQKTTPDSDGQYTLDVLSTVLQRDVFWLDPKLKTAPNQNPKPESKVETYGYYPVYHITR